MLTENGLEEATEGGTFVSAAGGTFETVMSGTFHSATGGTIKPLPSETRSGSYFIHELIHALRTK